MEHRNDMFANQEVSFHETRLVMALFLFGGLTLACVSFKTGNPQGHQGQPHEPNGKVGRND